MKRKILMIDLLDPTKSRFFQLTDKEILKQTEDHQKFAFARKDDGGSWGLETLSDSKKKLMMKLLAKKTYDWMDGLYQDIFIA